MEDNPDEAEKEIQEDFILDSNLNIDKAELKPNEEIQETIENVQPKIEEASIYNTTELEYSLSAEPAPQSVVPFEIEIPEDISQLLNETAPLKIKISSLNVLTNKIKDYETKIKELILNNSRGVLWKTIDQIFKACGFITVALPNITESLSLSKLISVSPEIHTYARNQGLLSDKFTIANLKEILMLFVSTKEDYAIIDFINEYKYYKKKAIIQESLNLPQINPKSVFSTLEPKETSIDELEPQPEPMVESCPSLTATQIRRAISEIFYFYTKQSVLASVKKTFDIVNRELNQMTLGYFLKVLKDFNIPIEKKDAKIFFVRNAIMGRYINAPKLEEMLRKMALLIHRKLVLKKEKELSIKKKEVKKLLENSTAIPENLPNLLRDNINRIEQMIVLLKRKDDNNIIDLFFHFLGLHNPSIYRAKCEGFQKKPVLLKDQTSRIVPSQKYLPNYEEPLHEQAPKCNSNITSTKRLKTKLPPIKSPVSFMDNPTLKALLRKNPAAQENAKGIITQETEKKKNFIPKDLSMHSVPKKYQRPFKRDYISQKRSKVAHNEQSAEQINVIQGINSSLEIDRENTQKQIKENQLMEKLHRSVEIDPPMEDIRELLGISNDDSID